MSELYDIIHAEIKDPVVDIIITVYQHEQYLSRALDSVLAQKTEYPFRIIVGDDCSPDRSAEIVLEYQRTHPDKITAVIWKKNSFSMGLRNAYELIKMSKARYLATLEGDDYWMDDRKLEKQISFLEENPEYTGCVHNIRSVDEEGSFFHKGYGAYPYKPEFVYSQKDAMGLRLVSQTSSVLFRNFYLDWGSEDWAMYESCGAHGDIVRNVYLGMTGKVLFMEDHMSCYRREHKGISYSGSNSAERKLWMQYYDKQEVFYYAVKRFGVFPLILNAWNDTWLRCKINLIRHPGRENIGNILKMIRARISLFFFLKKQGNNK